MEENQGTADGGVPARPGAAGRVEGPLVADLRARAAKDADGLLGLYVTREDLGQKGRERSAVGEFVREYAAAVRHPNYVRNERGRDVRDKTFAEGKAGIERLAAGFGADNKVRRLYFDVDRVADKLARGRKPGKEETVAGAVAQHDVRESEKQERARVARARRATKGDAGRER